MTYFKLRLGGLFLLFVCITWGLPGHVEAQVPAAEMAWALHSEPGTVDAAKVDDQSAETVRFLTAGVLLRMNRHTLQTEPGLAERWSVSADGRVVTFQIRGGLRFSDGSPLGVNDVVASLRRVLLPETAAPVSEEFLEPRLVVVEAAGPLAVRVRLPKRVVSIGRIFDEIAIEPAARPGTGLVTAGPFHLVALKRGEYLLLERNPYFWKKDAAGNSLPYLRTIRLDIVSNREMERLRFIRGDYQVLDNVSPDDYDRLAKSVPGAHDYGASLNTEQMWFNQSGTSPLPGYERAWFENRMFRQAVSVAIHRADLARIAYKGHATPAYGFISPANPAWYDPAVRAREQALPAPMELLRQAGFHQAGRQLLDAGGNAVRFSILTNAGNRARETMATLIQQDLAALGMQVNVVRLDFPALIERLMHTQDYEAALLGLSNVDPDPNAMMNVWLSSSPNHQWNPSEKKPATDWEAEIDRLMETQAGSTEAGVRRHAVDRLQQIVAEQQPFIYLVHPNLLYAVAPSLEGANLSVLQPGVVADIETMRRSDIRR